MSGTKGSSGFGSQSKEHIDKRTETQNKNQQLSHKKEQTNKQELIENVCHRTEHVSTDTSIK